MILTLLALRPRPGRARDIIELFERESILERALSVGGYRGVEIWEGEGEVLATATWDSAESYETWVDHPVRNAAAGALNELLDAPISGEHRGGRYTLTLCGGEPALRITPASGTREAGGS